MVRWHRIGPDGGHEPASHKERLNAASHVAFYVDGIRFKGREGANLLEAVMADAKAGKTDWRGSQGFAIYETRLETGEVARAPLHHFTVRENQRFRRVRSADSLMVMPGSRTRVANWLRRYAKSLRKTLFHKPRKELPLKKAQFTETEIAILGGGIWGRVLAEELAAAGRDVTLIHQGEMRGLEEVKGLKLLPHARAVHVSPDGEIWLSARIDYQSLIDIRLKARLIVFAQGIYDKALPFSGMMEPDVLPLELVIRLNEMTGLLPKGKIVAAINNETAFNQALDLAEKGLDLSLILDNRQPGEQKSLARAMVTGVRIAALTSPHKAGQEKGGWLKIRYGATHDPDDKFAREEVCDALLISGGLEPRLRLFLQAGGRISPASRHFPRAIATKTPHGVWLIPVGSMCGQFDHHALDLGEMATEITLLALNPERGETSFTAEALNRGERAAGEVHSPRGALSFAKSLDGEDITGITSRFAGNPILAGMTWKLRQEKALSLTPASYLLERGLPLGALYEGLESLAPLPFTARPKSKDTKTGQRRWPQKFYPETTFWQHMGQTAIPARCEEPRSRGFMDVTGLLESRKKAKGLAILAIDKELDGAIGKCFSSPVKCGFYSLYLAKSEKAASEARKLWHADLPMLSLEDVAAMAIAARDLQFFATMSNIAYGLSAREPLLLAPEGEGEGALPQPGDSFSLSAHSQSIQATTIFSTKLPERFVVAMPEYEGLDADILYCPHLKRDFRRVGKPEETQQS